MKNLSVLIVDDNDIDRYILTRQLNEIGVDDIFECDDGSTALDFLENYHENKARHKEAFPPVVIFLDINMPIVGGFEFIERFAELRLRFALESCVIMMYSSSERQEDIDRASSYDFVKDFLIKGEMHVDELKTKMSKLKKMIA